MALPNLISLDGTEVTDQGRTFSSNREETSVQVQLASGITKKYFMDVKYTFSLNWTMLPNLTNQTFDGKAARDFLKTLSDKQDTITLIVRSPIGSSNTYTVWVDSYSEKIIRRDYVSNNIYYDVELTLKEQ
jgi:hypothetical protein